MMQPAHCAIVASFSDILLRVDALNSYVRSKSRRGFNSQIHRVIYHYKREALNEATRRGIVAHRLIALRQVCRDCGGTKCYVDSSGYSHPHCRRCYSKGEVKLRFVESTFMAGPVWHTPEGQSWSFLPWGRPERDIEHGAGDWGPNQLGRDLSPQEVAEHLLAVEAFFPNKPQSYTIDSDYNCFRYFPHDEYLLWVGDADREICGLCGSTGDMRQCGSIVRTGRLEWCGYICHACERLHKEGVRHFELLATRIPESLLTPAVREWSDKHPVTAKRT